MCHCAPVFRIHKTASRTRRVGIGLRPGRLSGTFSSGKCSRIRSHWSSRSFNTDTSLRHYIDVRNDFEIGSSQFGLIALCGASALLAYPLWAGRYWALLALRFLVLLTVVPVVVLSIADFGHAQGGLSTNLGDLAFYGSLFTIPMFVLAVLFHPNVIQEFRHQNVSGS